MAMYTRLATAGTVSFVPDIVAYLTEQNAVLMEADLSVATGSGANIIVNLPQIQGLIVEAGANPTFRINGTILAGSAGKTLKFVAATGDSLCGDASAIIGGDFNCFELEISGLKIWQLTVCTPNTIS